jgi:hypothetical protein
MPSGIIRFHFVFRESVKLLKISENGSDSKIYVFYCTIRTNRVTAQQNLLQLWWDNSDSNKNQCVIKILASCKLFLTVQLHFVTLQRSRNYNMNPSIDPRLSTYSFRPSTQPLSRVFAFFLLERNTLEGTSKMTSHQILGKIEYC